MQNLLLYAVTQKTAAEIILARANPADPHFGLRSWKGAQARKQDIVVAKNYLSEDEIDIDLPAVHTEMLAVEEKIGAARQRHNQFLAELGLPPLP